MVKLPQQASAQDKSIVKCATVVRNGKDLATAMPSDGNATQWQFQAAALPSSSTTKQRHYQPVALPSSSKTKHASGNDSASSKTQKWRTILMQQSTYGVRDGNNGGNINSNIKGQQQCRQQQCKQQKAAAHWCRIDGNNCIAFPVHSSCHAVMAMALAHLWLENL